MGKFVHVWALECPKCHTQTVLPNQNLREISQDQQYWPKDTETLTIRCHNCERLSVYCVEADRPTFAQKGLQELQAKPLWKVTIECGQKDCETLSVVHMQAEENLSSEGARARILLSIPMPKFSCGHALTEKNKWTLDSLALIG